MPPLRYGLHVAARTITKDVNVSLRLTAQMREDAERVALSEGMNLAEWFRHLARGAILEHETEVQS